ncbi:hypothetical protein ACJJTC_019514 [Scirpophaga incertulas]
MAKRREWMDDLKQPKKKAKVKILNQKIYVGGKLIASTENTNSNITEAPNEDCEGFLITPHQERHEKKELTPTFRNPDSYIKETNEVLKKITPCKPSFCEQMSIQNKENYFKEDLYSHYYNFNPNQCQLISNDSSIRLAQSIDHLSNLETNYGEVQSPIKGQVTDILSLVPETNTSVCEDPAAGVPRSPSPAPGTNTGFRKDRAANILRSTSPAPRTSTCFHKNRAASVPRSMSPAPRKSTSFRKDRAVSAQRSSSHAPGTSTDFHKHLGASIQRSMSSAPETSTGFCKDRSASVQRSTSPAPGTSTDFYEDRDASVQQSTSSAPGTSTGFYKDRGASVQRSTSPASGTSNSFHEDPVIGFSRSLQSPSPSPGKSTKKQKRNNFPRQCKRKLEFNKAYLDFLGDDAGDNLLNEVFSSEDSGSWSEQETSSESDKDESQPNVKKTKKGKKSKITKKPEIKRINIEKSKPKFLIKKENNIRRQNGKSYFNGKGNHIEAKKMKLNPCIGKKCRNGCGEILEDRRQALFQFFWNLQNQQRRKDWIAQITVQKPVKKCTINTANTSRRGVTYEYYINDGEERRKVCQQFLIATLDISQRFILYTAETTIDGFAKLDDRGKHGSHNKTPDDVIQHAKLFMSSLPLLPSHYCRRESNRLYLSEDVKNFTNLYEIYVTRCKEDETKPMSHKVFSAFFKKGYNIGFHVPKKDKCNLCTSFKTYDVQTKEDTEKMNIHLKEKEESQKRFLFHQTIFGKDKSIICASFDMQKVLNTPHGTNMSLYYSRKIAVYNFTVYESGTRFGFCYIWSETDAHRGANEISSCLLNYIQNVDSRNLKKLLLYSDSCFGQNKNKTVLSMLRYALKRCINLEVIQINFLLPGHTYMPADSMHATIERAVRKTTVWAPSHWATVIEMARKNPFPYKVTVLEGKDFMGFEDVVNKTFKKTQKIMMSHIRIATFQKSKPDVMIVKHSMVPDAPYIEVKLGDIGDKEPYFNLYPAKLPISVQKYNDLKKLIDNKVIPSHCAKEYLDLKFNKKTIDCLPDTDEEE